VGRGKACQETGLRKCSSGKAEEIWSRLPWLSKFAQTDIIFLLNRRILLHSFNCLGVFLKKERQIQINLSQMLFGRKKGINKVFFPNIHCK